MDRILHDLNYLRLDELSDEWVEAIYYAEFLEFEDIPSEYERVLENIEIPRVFRKIMNAVDEWVQSDDGTSEEKSWAALSHEVKHRKLLALLAYYIDLGAKNILSQEHRNTAILASRVYFNLLSIPGYKAYHIYHSQLFAQSLGCLSYPKTLCENEDNYFNTAQLTKEVNSVLKELACFVQSVRAIIHGLQLNPTDMNFEDILSNLVEFTGGAIVNKLHIDKIELLNVSSVIYEMIDILMCDVNAEPNPDAIQLLFKCLLPKFVAASVDNRSANNLVRASYVTYAGLVLTKYGKSALSAFITLLEHLCYTQDGLERAEVRSARVSLVVGLMSLLPQKSYRYIVRWILKLSTTAKVAHRHIAMELISQLLNNDAEESADPTPTTQPANPDTARADVDCNNLSNQDSVIDIKDNQNSQVAPNVESQQVACANQDNQYTQVVENVESQQVASADQDNQYSQVVENVESQQVTSANQDNQYSQVVENVESQQVACTNQDNCNNTQSPNQDSSLNNTLKEIQETRSESPVAGPSGIQNASQENRSTGQIETSPDTPDNVSLSEVVPANFYLTDSGIQDSTIGFGSEYDDYIMSLLAKDTLALGEIPEAMPELGNIEDFSMFGEMSDQSGPNNRPESKDNAGEAVLTEVNLVASDTGNVNLGEENIDTTTRINQEPDVPTEAQKRSSELVDENQRPPSTEDESSQETILLDNPEVVSEEDLAGLLRQRPHTVSHAALLRALYERVHDVSSTLRTRALAILADCLASQRAPVRRAVTELNGEGSVSRLMVVAARCVSDERAAVRRAAVALVHRSLLAAPPAPADRGILVSLCRDASIVVRGAAIAALGELVLAAPAAPALDAFLAGPLHQLSDPEAKIQEQVLALVQRVALDGLRARGADEDPLPWMFLAAVARHNMRRHLQRACELLFKTARCINHRIVDAASTHLGAGDGDERDLQALVLLTSAARLIDYSDVRFLLDYYYSLADCQQERDRRLLPLTAELLTLWSRYVPPAERARLRDHLAARLASAAADDGSRIPCAMLAAHLDPKNLQWANELLALAERRALSGGVQEWLRAADVSLVAPAQPAPALLQMFLAALRNPPPGECSLSSHTPATHSAAAADVSLVAPALLQMFLAALRNPPPGECSLSSHTPATHSAAAADVSLVAPALLQMFLAALRNPPPGECSLSSHTPATHSAAAADVSLVAPALLQMFLAALRNPPPGECSLSSHTPATHSAAAADVSLVAPALLQMFLAALRNPPPGECSLSSHTPATHSAAAADVSLVAPALLQMFLAALRNPPPGECSLSSHTPATHSAAAADVSLVAPALLQMFLAALRNPPPGECSLSSHTPATHSAAAADVSLVAPALLQMFLAALRNPPPGECSLSSHTPATHSAAAADVSLVAPALLQMFLAALRNPPPGECSLSSHTPATHSAAAADVSLVAPALLQMFLAALRNPPPGECSLSSHTPATHSAAAADVSLVAPALLQMFLAALRNPPPGECSLSSHTPATHSAAAADVSLVAPALLQMFLAALRNPPPGECSLSSHTPATHSAAAADVSLVAPALLQMFLAALRNPPPEWTAACQGAATAGAGRLCVRSRAAAAAAAPVLAALLHSSDHALPARVNALLALADICVRYTCIVEPLMDSVCACLGAGAPPALRRAAARALTRLLLAGYLRLRTPLYYRYCALLADSDADVREPAEYFVSCCLPPDSIYHHFVDCVLHYNRQPAESISFDARQLIYDVMLQRMSLVQKLNIQCRLARDVLERAADMTEEEQDGALTPAMSAALLDTITLLCGPRMKLPRKPQNQGDVADIDDLQERVTTNIVSHKMKRTVAEVLVPAVLRLHARVRRGGGQVAAYLVRIATDLLNDYRQEIEELIDNDSELVERVAEFQQNIGLAPLAGNARNLVTASAPPDPDTPRARRRPRAPAPGPPRKRALRV